MGNGRELVHRLLCAAHSRLDMLRLRSGVRCRLSAFHFPCAGGGRVHVQPADGQPHARRLQQRVPRHPGGLLKFWSPPQAAAWSCPAAACTCRRCSTCPSVVTQVDSRVLCSEAQWQPLLCAYIHHSDAAAQQEVYPFRHCRTSGYGNTPSVVGRSHSLLSYLFLICFLGFPTS